MSTRIRLGMLRMDELPEHALHVRGNYPELYTHLFRAEGIELVDVPVHRGATPGSLAECDGWLFTGSRHSVYDDLVWIATALDLVRAAIAEQRPAVGICFGHQLFAQALGGRVGKAGWGLGAQHYETVQPLPWFPEAAERLTLIASHQDQVLELPDGAAIWSRSDYCPIAGMTVGEAAWSVQGHPEFTADVAHVLYEGRRDRVGDEAVDTARASLDRPLSNSALAAAVARFVRASG